MPATASPEAPPPRRGREPMEITLGMEKALAARPGARRVLALWRGMGGTSVETYLRWGDVEPEQGRWDWSVFDADLEALQAAGLRWVPFLILGPWYATPAWLRQGPQSVPAVCLEHRRPCGNQSIWNPHLFPWVQRFLEAFAAHYAGAWRPGGPIESLLLGISGDYGEAIQTVTGNWPGEYHGHAGYWCADPYALADFRAWAQRRYGTLEALGRAWGSEAARQGWEALWPPRSPTAAPSARAWLDFVAWYREAMTAWAGRWLEAARRICPGAEVYLCTGGDMTPAHGSDFSEQCRVAAAAGAGVRITNEASDYVQNLLLTRLVASACRHYGGFCGLEPAAAVDARGVAARQFNATGCGARQLHEYQGNLLQEGPADAQPRPEPARVWQAGRPLLHRRIPASPVALLHSLPDLALREAGILGSALPLARALRTVCDFEVLDDHLVAAGALLPLRAAFLTPSRLWSAETARRLQAFVAAGGILVAAGTPPEELVDGAGDAVLPGLFGFTPQTEELTGISAVVPADGAALPATAAQPPLHLGKSYRGLDPEVVPLLRTVYRPAAGGQPLVLWYRREGRGAAVFYAGILARGEGWMAAPGAAEALITDLLVTLPAALGQQPVVEGPPVGVYETPCSDGWLGWNPGEAPAPWRGQTLAPWAMGEAAGRAAGIGG